MTKKRDWFYRFTIDKLGIYETVDRDYPKDKGNSVRLLKPDGGWLSKEGPKYPGAISYWTSKGLEKYCKSGLFYWHDFVTEGDKKVLIGTNALDILYGDSLQIILNEENIQVEKEYSFADFFSNYGKYVL